MVLDEAVLPPSPLARSSIALLWSQILLGALFLCCRGWRRGSARLIKVVVSSSSPSKVPCRGRV